MSISKAFNHKTGVYYAYETTYEWSEEKQKKVPVRKCIGHFDPESGEIVPNGSRGRKPVYARNESSKPIVQEKPMETDQCEYLASVFEKITDICADAVSYFRSETNSKR